MLNPKVHLLKKCHECPLQNLVTKNLWKGQAVRMREKERKNREWRIKD